MKIAFHVAFGIHLLSILGVIALLIVSYKKTPRALNPGVLHSAATALVAITKQAKVAITKLNRLVSISP